MKSIPTIDKPNQEKYLGILQKADPEMYLIKIALEETGVNPMLVPKIIRSIANLAIGSGHGKVSIFMQEKQITNINGEERVLVNDLAITSEN